MLKPTKIHAEGCLHSTKPELVIAGASRNHDGSMTGDLATSLFFMRCDGSFKNIKAIKLEIGMTIES